MIGYHDMALKFTVMRKLLFLVLLCCSVTSMAITYFGYSDYNGYLNHAVLIRSLLKHYGADSVLKWRDPITKIRVDMDTSGCVEDVIIYRGPFTPEYRERLADELAAVFNSNGILFSPVFDDMWNRRIHMPLDHSIFKMDNMVKSNRDNVIKRKTPPYLIPLAVSIQHIDKNDLLNRYSDDNWYKPLLRCYDPGYLCPYDLNTSRLELSMLYAIGEYELYQLLKKGDLSVSLTTDSRGLPVEVRFRSISDKQLEQLIKERLIHFWKTQNFRFDVNGDSDSHTLEMTLTIPPLKTRSLKEIREAREAGWKSYFDLGW